MNRQRGIMSTVFKSEEKTQTLFHKEQRFTVQNNLTDASSDQRTNPKNKLSIRHKPLYTIKNGPQCKTRTREGAIEPALRSGEQRKNLMNRPGKSHPKSESFYLTQILVCHEERSGMQNKITDGGPMKNESK